MGDRLSRAMLDELQHRCRADGQYGGLYVGTAEPQKIWRPSGLPHIRTLVALWRRGLIDFDITAHVTEAGREAVRRHQRRNAPGARNFTVIGPSDDDGPE